MEDRDTILGLICEEQLRMLKSDPTSHESERYRSLEGLKVRVDDKFKKVVILK